MASYYRTFLNDKSLDNGQQIPEQQVTNLVEDLASTGTGLLVRQNDASLTLDASAIISGVLDAARIPSLSSVIFIQSADPGAATTADVGKIWVDTTTITTVVKICVNIAGVISWRQF